MLFELLRATFEMGLPVLGLSWLLFYRLYSRGELARDADRKAIDASLKNMKKAEKESEEPSDSLLHGKWMKFGGGFYGVVATWTLLVIEASGIASVIAHPSSLEAMFHKGPVDFIVNQVTNQVSTFVQAAVWFNWWPERGHGPALWFVIAYVAYVAGFKVARYEFGLGTQVVNLDSRARWRSMIAFRKEQNGEEEI